MSASLGVRSPNAECGRSNETRDPYGKLTDNSEEHQLPLNPISHLNSGYRLQRDSAEQPEEGTLNRTIVHPRRAMETALRCEAFAIVFAHDHLRAIVPAASTVTVCVIVHPIATGPVFSFWKARLL